MKTRDPIFTFSLTVLLNLMMAAGIQAYPGWKWNSRGDVSFVQDDNVLENITAGTADINARIFADISGGKALSSGTTLSIEYRGGIEAYKTQTGENRMIHDLSARLLRSLRPKISAGLTVQTRAKTFFQARRGYVNVQCMPALSWQPGSRTQAGLFASYSYLDYTDGTLFDFHRLHAGLRFSASLSTRFHWKIQALIGRFDYRRPALDYQILDVDTYQWIILEGRQRDRIREISSTLEWYHFALIRCIVAYQWVSSNSYGYSHTRPKLQIIAAKTFPWSLTLRVYWTLHRKEYTDSLQPILQVSPDAETEDNSYILADLTKDLKEDFSLRLRIGKYRNESLFRDLYYEKTLISLGIAKRF